ncbi:hypothetical protein EJV47_04655 [Hymenobacter gummosus]|uniref:DUF559 domain-containing protein n=1 Tax=Hymenobacter gummosus TaxID=1776032 RepID=A0A3S0H939_9BACT|nr:hypothetical protein [Hymenobacter gummosus]RTQ52317.1 hypothetical protein EJV47_04655 [Hymenobacter gummosus]
MVTESRLGYYPEVVLPADLKVAMQAVPPVPQEPVRPVVPPTPNKVSTFNFGFVVLGGAFLILLIGSELGVLGMGFGVVLLIIQHFSIQSAKRAYTRNLHSHTVATRALEEYPGKKLRYEQELARYRQPGYSEQYRREQIAQELKSTSEPVPMSAMQQLTIRKGSSEAQFEQLLKQWFGATRIDSSLCLPIAYRSFDNNYYYPDFVYRHPSGLCIDIEIDEPYTGITKEPIHYQGQDHQRNKYFAEKGWVVVRFAEQQIITQPELCCKLLAEVIAQLVPGQVAAQSTTGILTPVPKWTFEQAKEMARRDVRDLYKTLPTL